MTVIAIPLLVLGFGALVQWTRHDRFMTKARPPREG